MTRGILRRLGMIAVALVVAAPVATLAPPSVAAVPTVVLTLSIKPARIDFGGTFTLTATITPSAPVTGLVRVGIFAENGGAAYGHMHDCTPGCSLQYPGTAEFDFDGLDAKQTMKVLWTDEGQSDDPTSNRFNVGMSAGDVNYSPLDWVRGYIGGAAPTATPRITPRPTPKPTVKATSAPPPAATAVPTAIPTTAAEATPALESSSAPASAPASAPPSTAPAATTAITATTPPGPAPTGEVASTAPLPVLAIALIAIVAGGLLILRGRRRNGMTP